MSFESKVTPWERLGFLKQSIKRKGFVRMLEAHNGLSGIIAEGTRIKKNGEIIEYDGIWVSGLTETASKGLPDASITSFDSRLHTIDEILNVTTKPIVVDGDTGGEATQFEFLVRHLERLGVSAVIIEDKVFPKRNSLDTSALQTLEDPTTLQTRSNRAKRRWSLTNSW